MSILSTRKVLAQAVFASILLSASMANAGFVAPRPITVTPARIVPPPVITSKPATAGHNLNMTSAGNLNATIGHNLNMTSAGNLNATAGHNLNMTSSGNLNSTINHNLNMTTNSQPATRAPLPATHAPAPATHAPAVTRVF